MTVSAPLPMATRLNTVSLGIDSIWAGSAMVNPASVKYPTDQANKFFEF